MNSQRTKRFRNLGQSTVELALLLPIVAGLLYLTIQGFGVNHKASEDSIQGHVTALQKFDHGNGTIFVAGVEVPASSLSGFIPTSSFNPTMLATGLATAAADLGINNLLDKAGLTSETWLGGAAHGGALATFDSWSGSGFKSVDSKAVLGGTLAGATASQQATEFFQGDNWATGDFRELVGSGVQNAIVGYGNSKFEVAGALAGAAGGMLGSDAAKGWFENGKEDVLKGAFRGALQGSVAGLANGKLDFKTVAIATGMGAFNTKTVAEQIPGASWSGDPRMSATFGATSGALGTLLSGGNVKDALYSASSGALFSGQSIHTIAGDSKYVAAGMGAVYGAGVGYLQGENGGRLAMHTASSFTQGMVAGQLAQVFQNAQTVPEVKNRMGKEETRNEATEGKSQEVDQNGQVIVNAVPKAAAMVRNDDDKTQVQE